MKKILFKTAGWILVLALLAVYLLIPAPVPAHATGVSNIQDGVTLHCWNWSFKSIEDNMASIARLGYTAIQTSPIQQAKQTTAGSQTYDWWVFYQPVSFSIDNTGNSALGTKAQFQSMCQTAHKYGIKVIVDVVANHMGDNGGNNKSPAIIDDIEKDPSCWHDISKNTYDYSKRYDVTQWCMNGLPDLNTGSDKVQRYVLNFLKECIDAGADGFRFDAAKHIETPDDGRDNCASNFWPTVVNGAKSYAKSTRGINLYCYGELLDNPGGSLSVGSYTKYMNVTDNTWSNSVRNSVVGGRNAGAYSYRYHKDASSSQLVLWAESHDNYAGDGSSSVSVQNINKTWALVAARADAMSLYLARPSSYTQKLGTASPGTGWANKEVAAVNKFHTAFAGQGEYVSSEGGIAYVERGNSGVVLVNVGGSGSDVNVTNHSLKDGSYVDQVTGNKFTVSGGRIRGRIGDTGVAVVYNAPASTPVAEQVIYFTAPAQWSNVNVYAWYIGGVEITSAWPGNAMTKVKGDLYSCKLPADADNLIFNSGTSQTLDLTIPSGKNWYDYSTGKWAVYEAQEPACTHKVHDTSGKCTSCRIYVGHHYDADGRCACGAKQNIVCVHGVHDKNGICVGCGIKVEHRYVDGVCSCGAEQNIRCAHGGHGLDGICPDCGAEEVHVFVEGKCHCGAAENPEETPSEPEKPTEPEPEKPTEPKPEKPAPQEPQPTEPSTSEQKPSQTQPSPTIQQTGAGDSSEPTGGWVVWVVLGGVLLLGIVAVIILKRRHSAGKKKEK